MKLAHAVAVALTLVSLHASMPSRAASESTLESLLLPQLDLEGLRAKGPAVLPGLVRVYERSDESRRVGDAAFFLGDAAGASRAYRRALDVPDGSPALLYEKLADACFRLGDLEQERLWREKVYGTLR